MRKKMIVRYAVISGTMLALGSLAACQLDLEGAPCPCSAGWKCCKGVCVPENEACSGQGQDGGVDDIQVWMDSKVSKVDGQAAKKDSQAQPDLQHQPDQGHPDLVATDMGVPTLANSLCAKAQPLTLTNGYVAVWGTTQGAVNEFGTQITCGLSSPKFSGPQAYFKVKMTAGKVYHVTLDPLFHWVNFYIFQSTACTASAINQHCSSKGQSGEVWSGYSLVSGQRGMLLFVPQVTGDFTIAVESSPSAQAGDFVLRVDEWPTPANGTCAAAETLSLSGGKAKATNTINGTQNEFGTQIACGNSSGFEYDKPQVYYKVYLTTGKTYKVALAADHFDATFYIFGNTCNPVQINTDCSSNGASGAKGPTITAGSAGIKQLTGSKLFTPSSSGTYTIAVERWPLGGSGPGLFTLTVEEYQKAVNGTCQTAQSLTFQNQRAVATGDTTGIADEFSQQIACGGTGYGPFSGSQLYYKAALSKSKTYKIMLMTTAFAAYLYIFGDTCSAAQIEADCTQNPILKPYSLLSTSFSPTKDGTYTFAVDSQYSTASYDGPFTLVIEEQSSSVPPNATCATAQTVTLGSTPAIIYGDTTSATNEFGTQITCGDAYGNLAGEQVYYKAYLSGGKTYTLKLTSYATLARLYIFSDTCSAAQLQADCSSKGKTGAITDPGMVPFQTVSLAFTPGSSGTYHFAVDNTQISGYSPGLFELEIQ